MIFTVHSFVAINLGLKARFALLSYRNIGRPLGIIQGEACQNRLGGLLGKMQISLESLRFFETLPVKKDSIVVAVSLRTAKNKAPFS